MKGPFTYPYAISDSINSLRELKYDPNYNFHAYDLSAYGKVMCSLYKLNLMDEDESW